MGEVFTRLGGNPLMRPGDVVASRAGWQVTCLLNPGVFEYGGKIGLLLRVAERPVQEKGWITTPVIDPAADGGVRIVRIRRDDPDLDARDPRVVFHKGRVYLTTLSHLRAAWSTDGQRFVADKTPTLEGFGPLETYGIEDARVMRMGDTYYLTYTSVSGDGHGVGMSSTKDFRNFTRHGMILPPANKDCALFPAKIGGKYWMLHRPSPGSFGGNFIWSAESPDLLHWGNHRCIAQTRHGMWDDERIGAGAEPIETDRGWLEIYHGANKKNRYCLGLMLLDKKEPWKVIARSTLPIMEPTVAYEQTGFFGHVVFTNGHLVRGDEVSIYYGASDEVICGAKASVKALLASLGT